MATSQQMLTSAEFHKCLPTLTKQLSDALERELKDCAWENDPATDLWDLPTVDSKTVCKLSPIVQSVLGRRLEPAWVRKGGYESVKAAVEDVIAQAQKHCVLPAQAGTAAKSSKATVTA